MFPGFQTFPEGQIIAFALVLLRLSAFVVSWPIFGSNTIPVQVKILLSLTLAVVMAPSVQIQNIDLVKIGDEIIFLSIREIAIGLFLGFLLRFIFFAVQISGEIIGISTGLASAQLFNPMMGNQGNVYEQFYVALATLLVLALNGHHMFIEGISKSFELAPIASIGLNTQAFTSIASLVSETFLIGLKMSAPIMAAMLVVNVTMGLVGRAVPQINVMMTGMQVTIIVGFFIFIITVPMFIEEVNVMLMTMADKVIMAMKVI